MKNKILSLFVALMLLLPFGTIITEAAGQDIYSGFPAESIDDYKCTNPNFKTNGLLAGIRNGEWACYRALDFGKDGAAAVELSIGMTPGYAQFCELRIDAPDGPLIASVPITPSTSWSIPVPSKANLLFTVKGVHDLYLTHSNETSDVFDIKFFPASSASSVMPEYTQGDAYTDIEDDANRRTINLLYQLGLLRDYDNKIFNPKLPVTRGEFVYSVFKLYGVEEREDLPLQMFTDVSSSDFYAQAVSYLTGLGIVKGVTENTFAPEAFIRHIDAIAIISRVLEYDDLVANLGGYPQGYLSVASDKDLLVDGVGSAEYLRRTDMAELLYNAVLAEGLYVTTMYNNAVQYGKTDGVLYKTQKLERERGVVTSNFITGLFLPETDVSDDEVVIGEEVYKVGETNAASLLGFDCEFFYREKNDEKTLVAIMPLAKVNTYVLSSAYDNIKAITDSEIVYYDSEFKREVIDIEKEDAVLYNGVAIDDSLEKLVGNTDIFSGEIRIIENPNGINVIMIDEYTDYIVKSVNTAEECIQDAITGEKVAIGGEDANSFYKTDDGQTAFLFNIEEGNVLTLYSSKNKTGKKYLRGYLSARELTGTVTKTENNTVYIDDIPYEISSSCKDDIDVLDSGIFKISKNNMIVAYEYAEIAENMVGLYFDYKPISEGISQKVQIKIYDQNDKTAVYSLADRVVVDGIRIKEADALENGTQTWQGLAKLDKETPVLYTLNEAKQIVTLDTVLEGAGGADDMLKQISNGTETYRYRGNIMLVSGVGRCYLPRSAKVIAMFGDQTNEDNISFTTVDKAFSSSVLPQGEIYSTCGDIYNGDLLVWRNSSASTSYSDMLIFEEITTGILENGDVVRYVRGTSGTSEEAFILTEEDYQSGALSLIFKNVKPGDALRVRIDPQNRIYEAEVLFLFDGAKERGSIIPAISKETRTSGDVERDFMILYGKIDKKGENYIALDVGSRIDLVDRSSAEVVTVTKRGSDGKFLISSGQTAQNISVGDVVLSYIKNGITKQIVIYKDHTL